MGEDRIGLTYTRVEEESAHKKGRAEVKAMGCEVADEEVYLEETGYDVVGLKIE